MCCHYLRPLLCAENKSKKKLQQIEILPQFLEDCFLKRIKLNRERKLATDLYH